MIRTAFADWLLKAGIGEGMVDHVVNGLLISVLLLLACVADAVAKRILLRVLTRVVKKTPTQWDDILLEKGVFNRLSHLAPAIVVYALIPVVFPESTAFISFIRNTAFIYMVVISLLVADSFLNGVYDIYLTFDISKQIPLKGFVQAVKLVVVLVGGILILSALTNRTPLYFLSGLGALTAVLMLIFKDAILGFVAGIQITANNLVRPGDWIEMPQFGADGDVIDVSLTTVKVQNWDKTITSIPTYALISSSFKNWRGMEEAGGRRIKRAINLDMTSIRFCDEEMLERYSRIQLIRDYVDRKRREIDEWNRANNVDQSCIVNGRRLTNIGTFRAYVEAYLRSHPRIHKDMTFLVRQLRPTEKGLPIEIYVFSNDTAWASYEAIQADIFDHLLAVLPYFDLRIFQNPSGADFRAIAPQRES